MATREALFGMVDRFFDGDRAKALAASLTKFYRSPGSSGYLEATAILERAFRSAGFDDLAVSDHPVENAWEPRAASLALVDGDREIVLVDYEEAPTCIAWWSDSTPTGGEVLEVVDVGTGERPEDFHQKDVTGKAVFIHGTTRRPGWWEAARLAAERGARGLITDYMLYQIPGIREPHLLPDAVQLLRLPIREDSGIWGFAVSKNAADRLKARLASGNARVRATVDVTSGPSVVRNLLATIPGSDLPEESILFCAHASGVKPGANCAEGPAMLVELAGALRSAIEEGLVPRPRRSLRFLIGCEGAGVAGYFKDRPQDIPGIHAALTYCSPGHRQDLTRSNLMLYHSPDSVPGYINDYLAELAAQSPKEADWIEKDGGAELPQIRFAEHFYTPWSDNSRFSSEGIQAPLFMSWPDRYFHSQLLTSEVIDPLVLRRAALISGVAGLELASAGPREAARIARLVAGRARARLARVADGLQEPALGLRAGRMLREQLVLESDSIRRVLALASGTRDAELQSEVERLVGELRRDVDREMLGAPEWTLESDRAAGVSMVPVRTGSGRAPRWAGLSYSDLLEVAQTLQATDDNAGFNSLRVVADEVWAFVDGERTVEDIALAVGLEFDLDLAPDGVLMLLQGLERAGYVALR